MRSKTIAMMGILSAAVASPAFAQDEEASGPHSFSVTAWAVSDYVFRGVSQTQEDPAFQLGFDYSHESGFYAGVWGSSIDFVPDSAPSSAEDDANVEIDTYVGFRFPIGDALAADVSVVRYNYPGTNDGFEYEYNELIGKLTVKEWLTFTLGYSNDVFNSGDTGIYYGASGTWALPAEFNLAANVGYYDLDNFDEGYVDYGIGVTRAFGPFEFGVSYVGTNNNGEDLFGTLADDRFLATVKFGF